MPQFIAALVYPVLQASAGFFSGPSIVNVVGVPNDASTRRELIEQLTSVHPGNDAVAAQMRSFGDQLLTIARAIDHGEEGTEAAPPDVLPYRFAGHCLDPLIAGDAAFIPVEGEIRPGDIVVTTWRGVLWKMAKIYLGRTPDGVAAVFWQNSPLVAYEVPVPLITHAVKLDHPNVAERLPPEAVHFMRLLDPAPTALPREASANDGFTIVIREMIEAIRALPV